jgi:allene oxide cyclase-like protein
MRPSWKALIVAVAVLLATVGVMSLAVAAPGQDTTLTLTSKTVQFTELDLGKKGFSQGDQFVFTDQIFQDGKRVGLLGGTCTLVYAVGSAPGPESRIQCVVTFDLANGQVTAQGLFAFVPPRNAPFAITGGTGAYRDAGGQGTVTFTGPTTARFVLHILHLK